MNRSSFHILKFRIWYKESVQSPILRQIWAVNKTCPRLTCVRSRTRMIAKCHSTETFCVHAHSRRCFSILKNFDFRNDPETKALLNEITSDFDDEKKDKSKDDHLTARKAEERKENVENHTMELNEHKITEDNKESVNNSDKFEIEDVEGLSDVGETWAPPVSLQRGVNGVFDVDELVTLLEKENCRDIAVIDIPEEACYADHMVIVSAVSLRHLKSISSRVKWIHKKKKDKGDPSLKVEGFETAHDWHAMDLGNIILHVFMPETRELYDLETLWLNWGQGGQVVEEGDPYMISPEDEFWTKLEAQNETPDKK